VCVCVCVCVWVSLSLSLSFSLSLSLSLTHTLAHSLTLTHSHTHLVYKGILGHTGGEMQGATNKPIALTCDTNSQKSVPYMGDPQKLETQDYIKSLFTIPNHYLPYKVTVYHTKSKHFVVNTTKC
jgi:hypothetical protein